MNTTTTITTQLSYAVIASIRVSLRLQIVSAWNKRSDSFYRQQLKENIHALRAVRGITMR